MIEAPDFLPLGSVVTVYGSDKKLMIVSRGVLVGKERKPFDYGMCLFPEGFDNESVIYGQRSSIENVVFRGYENDETRAFDSLLAAIMPEEGAEASKVIQELW